MHDLDEERFDAWIAESSDLILVDFFADWCGPCKALGPVLAHIETEFPSVRFAKVNVDDNPRLAAAFGIRSLPSVVILQPHAEGGAAVVHSTIGVQGADYWRKQLTRATTPKRSLWQRLRGKH